MFFYEEVKEIYTAYIYSPSNLQLQFGGIMGIFSRICESTHKLHNPVPCSAVYCNSNALTRMHLIFL